MSIARVAALGGLLAGATWVAAQGLSAADAVAPAAVSPCGTKPAPLPARCIIDWKCIGGDLTWVEVWAPAGTTCNDGDACTTNDVCFFGGCMGTRVTCSPRTPCETAACSGGACVYSPYTCSPRTACETAACNGNAGCTYGPYSCSARGPCESASCGGNAGCSYTPSPPGPCPGSQNPCDICDGVSNTCKPF